MQGAPGDARPRFSGLSATSSLIQPFNLSIGARLFWILTNGQLLARKYSVVSPSTLRSYMKLLRSVAPCPQVDQGHVRLNFSASFAGEMSLPRSRTCTEMRWGSRLIWM